MTRDDFRSMEFNKLMEWAYIQLDDVTTEETLKDFAIENIKSDNIYLALHILDAINYVGYCSGYYIYDYNMGTLMTPSLITDREDIEYLIDFDE